MCGLCGQALHDPRQECDRERLTSMAQTLRHRGPDDFGLFVSGRVGVSFRRLSIIDLEGGHQPLFNETGDVALVMNGEIYNFRDLRAALESRGHRFRSGSDAEVIVHLYEEQGRAAVHELVGMFAFALLDLRDGANEVLLARDRLGIKPLYWAETPEGLIWASEPKAILAASVTPRRLRAPALLDYLVQGFVGGETSAWEGIRRLPPGHTLSWRPGGPPDQRRYWELPTEGLRGPAESDEILHWLDRAVADRLVADVPLGAFLSGGIDSTAVVTSMARADQRPVVACTVGFQERSYDELPIAERSARSLDAIHHSEILRADPALAIEELPWFFDEPHADPSNVPTYLVSRMARQHVKVALSGDGGDETFAGYRRYVHDVAENLVRRRLGRPGRALCRTAGRFYPKLDWAPRFLRARTFLGNVGEEPGRAYWRSITQLERTEALELLAPDVADSLSSYDPFVDFERHYRRPQVDDPLYRAQFADFHTFLPEQILAKVDRASMANSLEVRVPILDHRLCGRFVHLPANQKVRSGRGKYAFREALRSRLPREVLDGRKRGFDTPLRSWIRGPLAPAVGDAIGGLPDEWFAPAVLQRKLREHLRGGRDHGRLLWSLLVLEHWRRRHEVRGLSA